MVEENATMLVSPKFLCNSVTNHFERRFCYWDLHTLSCRFFPICTINVPSLVFPPLSSPVALTILRPLISIILEFMTSLSPGASDQTQQMKQAKRPKVQKTGDVKGDCKWGYEVRKKHLGLKTLSIGDGVACRRKSTNSGSSITVARAHGL